MRHVLARSRPPHAEQELGCFPFSLAELASPVSDRGHTTRTQNHTETGPSPPVVSAAQPLPPSLSAGIGSLKRRVDWPSRSDAAIPPIYDASTRPQRQFPRGPPLFCPEPTRYVPIGSSQTLLRAAAQRCFGASARSVPQWLRPAGLLGHPSCRRQSLKAVELPGVAVTANQTRLSLPSMAMIRERYLHPPNGPFSWIS